MPGTEPGVYLVKRDGTLLRTWQSSELGIDADCQVSEEEHRAIRFGDLPRWAWRNRHRVVNAILPLPEGPAFIVRYRQREATYWDLVRTGDREITRCRLPFRSTSERTQLAADLQGERVVFLISTPGAPEDRGPASEAKLIFARLPDAAKTDDSSRSDDP